MKNLPIWISVALQEKELKCFKCKTVFSANNLLSIGIRQSYQSHKQDVIFAELKCRGCDNVTMFELKKMSLVDFAATIIYESELDEEDIDSEEKEIKKMLEKHNKDKELTEDIINKRGKNNIRKKSSSSKISIKEIEESSKFLNNIKSHEEFLDELGLLPEQYIFTKTKDNKNDN